MRTAIFFCGPLLGLLSYLFLLSRRNAQAMQPGLLLAVNEKIPTEYLDN